MISKASLDYAKWTPNQQVLAGFLATIAMPLATVEAALLLPDGVTLATFLQPWATFWTGLFLMVALWWCLAGGLLVTQYFWPFAQLLGGKHWMVTLLLATYLGLHADLAWGVRFTNPPFFWPYFVALLLFIELPQVGYAAGRLLQDLPRHMPVQADPAARMPVDEPDIEQPDIEG